MFAVVLQHALPGLVHVVLMGKAMTLALEVLLYSVEHFIALVVLAPGVYILHLVEDEVLLLRRGKG